MLRIRYFASVREAMGREGEGMELPADVATVADLIRHLRATHSDFDRLHANGETVLAAVNQTVAGPGQALGEADEIAFFPPMSGG
ncbi:MAG: molybdopterin converting factor subunit 1 [Gammaproteobacteria bacterium]|nr:molybdopterin converting factor subunit 1 [Gammaproteobacteria bacterium]MCY4182449.1 molybdopterin converting factor subunit 1 [Gammaproteobacteria bacterium]MCY4270706.1 molybdopterin converting factor subunit 1 [Gammaproteobacteria bacterium]MCY4295577.1 molybdopterin converting factor subunit 1 [Gammaproteobacteria bacterium]